MDRLHADIESQRLVCLESQRSDDLQRIKLLDGLSSDSLQSPIPTLFPDLLRASQTMSMVYTSS
jgi:hypothetical protein